MIRVHPRAAAGPAHVVRELAPGTGLSLVRGFPGASHRRRSASPGYHGQRKKNSARRCPVPVGRAQPSDQCTCYYGRKPRCHRSGITRLSRSPRAEFGYLGSPSFPAPRNRRRAPIQPCGSSMCAMWPAPDAGPVRPQPLGGEMNHGLARADRRPRRRGCTARRPGRWSTARTRADRAAPAASRRPGPTAAPAGRRDPSRVRREPRAASCRRRADRGDSVTPVGRATARSSYTRP